MRRRRRAGDRVHGRLRRPPGSRVNPSTLGLGKYPSRDTARLNALGAYRPAIGAADDRPTASLRREPAPPVHRPSFSLVAPRSSLNQAAAPPQGHRAQRQHTHRALPVADKGSRKADQPAAAPLMAKRRREPAPSKCRIVAVALVNSATGERSKRSCAPARTCSPICAEAQAWRTAGKSHLADDSDFVEAGVSLR